MSLTPYTTINEFAIVGDFGFKRIPGPFDVEKESTKWTIVIPMDPPDIAQMTVETLKDDVGEAATLVRDGEIIGGGRVVVAHTPEGERELHLVVDQYAMGDDHPGSTAGVANTEFERDSLEECPECEEEGHQAWVMGHWHCPNCDITYDDAGNTDVRQI